MRRGPGRLCYHEWLLRASAKRVKGTHAKGNALFGIGGFELFLILLFGFLLFGPDKLPAMAKTLGKAIGKFRNAQEEMNKVIKNEVYDPDSDEPFKNPLDVMEKAANGASKAVNSASKAVSSHSSSTTASKPRPAGQQESFSERKARYDRERAAKQAAEAERAEAAKQAALAAADAQSTEAAAPETAAQAAPAASAAPAAPAAQSSATETKGE